MERTPTASLKASCWTAYLFLLPAMAVFACFMLFPLLGSAYMSLFDWTRGIRPQFVSLQNFSATLHDPLFWRACLNNLIIVIGSLVVQLPLAALLALLLNPPMRGKALFRTAFFAPVVMPSIAIAILWMNLYSPVDGPATKLYQLIVNSTAPVHWLSADSTSPWLPAPAMGSIFLTICWQYTGFHMVIFMAGLTAIPQDLYEAARIDGASETQLTWHITLPALKPTFAVSATLSVIGSLKYFDLIYLMGAAMAEQDREVVATYIYRLAFEQGQGRFGQGSAAAVLLVFPALILMVIGHVIRRRRHQP